LGFPPLQPPATAPKSFVPGDWGSLEVSLALVQRGRDVPTPFSPTSMKTLKLSKIASLFFDIPPPLIRGAFFFFFARDPVSPAIFDVLMSSPLFLGEALLSFLKSMGCCRSQFPDRFNFPFSDQSTALSSPVFSSFGLCALAHSFFLLNPG